MSDGLRFAEYDKALYQTSILRDVFQPEPRPPLTRWQLFWWWVREWKVWHIRLVDIRKYDRRTWED